MYVRPLDQFAAVPVRGSENATVCFFSPDGRAIAVIDAGGVLKTILLADGAITTVTDDVDNRYGAAWGADDRIVFVRAGTLWQVPRSGGTPKEIFYRSGNRMVAVEVSTAPNVVLSPPRVLFEQRYAFGAGITIANYDVTRDGQRFVMIKDESSAGRLNVVLNWFTELTRLVPP